MPHLHLPARLSTRSHKDIPHLVAATLFGIIGIAAIGYALLSQRHAPTPGPQAAGSVATMTSTHSKEPSSTVLPYSTPVKLTVPAIGIDAPLITVGKNADGSIKVPAVPHFDSPAWYRYSPTPGQYGAAIIIGHVDNYKTGASIFFNLGKLKPDDVIKVERKDGKTAIFKINAVREYKKSDFPTAAVYTAHNDAELRLITCGGDFNKATGHYENNTVVFATLMRVS